MGNAAAFPCDNHAEQYWGSGENQFSQKQSKFLQKNNLFLPKIASGIRLTGAVGIFSDSINSYFFETGQMYNGRMLYRNFSKKRTLWLRVSIVYYKAWLFSRSILAKFKSAMLIPGSHPWLTVVNDVTHAMVLIADTFLWWLYTTLHACSIIWKVNGW